MSTKPEREIYFSTFMFTADLKPEDSSYTPRLLSHLHAISDLGYDGFDVHIADRAASVDHQAEVDSYVRLKAEFDKASLKNRKFATNVGTTQFFDPTSPYEEQRQRALAYLKSRVDITAVLGGDAAESIMSGPFLYPYGVFAFSDLGKPIWSDALQDWMKQRFQNARSTIKELADYAQKKHVKLAIEPVKSWEMPPPNMVSEVLDFLDGIGPSTCGVTFDTAQILMESQGPTIFKENVARADKQNRLTYVHISAPDRGAIDDSWIPWETMLGEFEPVYTGPYLVEIFNAVPPFDSSMRMTRRRYWRPGEDDEGSPSRNAYRVADDALKELRRQIHRLSGSTAKRHESHAGRA